MSLILLAAAAAAAAQPKPCGAQLRPVQGAPRPGIHTLAQEPNAAAIRPVLRMVDGCPKPVLIRRDIGSQTKQPLPSSSRP